MFGSLASPAEHALITTSPSELAAIDDGGGSEVDIDLSVLPSLRPHTDSGTRDHSTDIALNNGIDSEAEPEIVFDTLDAA